MMVTLFPANPVQAPVPAAPVPALAGGTAPGEDFASLLGRMASGTAETVRAGEAASLAGIQGSLPLQTVVEKVMAAERTLQAALAVRDKLVGSYLEISRMQI